MVVTSVIKWTLDSLGSGRLVVLIKHLQRGEAAIAAVSTIEAIAEGAQRSAFCECKRASRKQ